LPHRDLAGAHRRGHHKRRLRVGVSGSLEKTVLRGLDEQSLRQATDDRYIHKFPAVSTVTGTPNFLAFLWKEGISKKPGQ
jgi:hypothetical protein